MRQGLGESNTPTSDIAGIEETTVPSGPTGQAELDLIPASGNLAFPPRLPGQPILYPVLKEEYAIEIARLELQDSLQPERMRHAISSSHRIFETL